MSKTLKRLISVSLAVILIVGAAPASGIAAIVDCLSLRASAANYSGTCGADGDNLTWSLDTSIGVLTISGKGNMDNFSYNSAPWYSYRSYIKTVTIGNGVTGIGSHAFSNCTGLTSITIPDSVTSIGFGAFYDCTGLTSVTIGNSVTSIGEGAFENCTGLTGVTIPDSVTSIGDDAFHCCTRLTSVIIGNSVTSIGFGAFYGCTGLTSVIIGNSVTSIGLYAFYNTAYYNNESNWTDGVLYIGKHLIKAKDSISGVYTVKDDTLCIADFAFYECFSLTSVTIGNGVTSIGHNAFYSCWGLASITIPDSVTSIESRAFYECFSLTSVTIPNGVTNIRNEVFYGCTGLTSVTIPDSVTSIENHAFENCTGLTSVTIPDSVTSIEGAAFYNTAYYNNESNWTEGVLYIGKHLIKAKDSISGAYTVKDGTLYIASYAFSGCTGLTSVTIPDSVTSIGDYAFYNCTGLTDVTIGNGVTSIGDSAFYNTAYYNNESNWTGGVLYIGKYLIKAKDSISDAYVIKDGTLYIADNAFYDCTGLTSVTIPGSVTSIGFCAFMFCTGLTKVTIGNGVTSIGGCAFMFCTRLTKVTIGNSVTSIGGGAFSGCTGLTSITIPDSVTGIVDDAFYNCTGLTSVTIGNGVTSIGYSAFYGCTGIETVCYDGTDRSAITFGNDNAPLMNANWYYHKHNEQTETEVRGAVAPTCKSNGYSGDIYYMPCGVLKQKGKSIPPDPNAHNYQQTRVTPPTCQRGGWTTHICVYCGDSYNDSETDRIPHQYNAVATAPTATKGGYTTYTCSMCGRKVTAHETPPTGSEVYTLNYNANGGTVQQQATYFKTYSKGGTITKYTPVRSGYSFVEWYPTLPSTMPDYNLTVYAIWKPEHAHETVILNQKEPTCDTNGQTGVVYCETCSEILDFGSEIPAKGHTWDKGTITTEATCTEPGVKTFACRFCDATEEKTIPVWDHCYDNGLVTVAPTCVDKGEKLFTCAACGVTYTETLSALGHSFDSGKITTAATCTADGIKTFTCTRCKTETYAEPVPALGHSFDSGKVTTQPTCTEDGIKTFTCTRCKTETYTETVPATGHSFDSGKVTTDPTCTEEGVKTFTCTVCGATRTEPVAALGHNYTFAIETLPTCTVDGVMRYTCMRCGDTYTKPINAAHKYNAVRTEPTCTEDGAITYTCTVCGDSYADPIKKLGHTYSDWEWETEPTINTDGLLVKKCSTCGNRIERQVEKTYLQFDVLEDEETGQEYAVVTGLQDVYPDKIIVPAELAGVPVTRIAEYAFFMESEEEDNPVGYSFIEAEILAPIEELEEAAFKYCTKLRSVMLPDSLKVIGDDAFYCCSELQRIDLPEQVESIRDMAFAYCVNLQQVTLPQGLKSIGYAAFGQCKSMQQIKLPECVEYLDEVVFAQSGLMELTIPASLSGIEGTAFVGCPKMTAFHVDTGNSSFMAVDGVLFDKSGKTLIAFPMGRGDTEYTVPDGVETIGMAAFDYVLGDKDVYDVDFVPASLQMVCLPSSLKTIGDVAFYGVTQMQSIDIPDGVTEIGEVAFAQCIGLKRVTIPAGIQTIGASAFDECDSLQAVCYAGTSTSWNRISIGSYNNALKNAKRYYHRHDQASATLTGKIDPTCTAEGYTGSYTFACGYVLGTGEVIPALGHAYRTEVTAPTCEANGYTTYTCTRCGSSHMDDIVDAIGHDYIVTKHKDATCTESGYDIFGCTHDPSHTYTQTIPAKGHDYKIEIIPPTCETKGYTSHTCTRCGERYVDNYVNALGHDFGEWVQTKAPTVDAEGEETRFCSRCEAKETRSVAKLPMPKIDIKNFTAQKTVDYKATVTFTAEIKNAVTGATVHWFIDGQDKGTGDTYTVTKAKKSFTVQLKYIKDGKTLAESGVETVNVKTGFFAKLAAFFKSIFGALPKVVQGYLGAEIVEGFFK